jgi:hypothetical protein
MKVENRNKKCAKRKPRKSYDMKYKLEAVEFAEMNSNEKAAKRFEVWYFKTS